jgi:hypothetical protein
MRRTTAESVIVESTRILRWHLGQRSASKPNERFMSTAHCASSQGWRVQQETDLPGQEPGAP